MSRLICAFLVLGLSQVLGAQAPLKTIEDGALDDIRLFVAALEQVPTWVVVVRP